MGFNVPSTTLPAIASGKGSPAPSRAQSVPVAQYQQVIEENRSIAQRARTTAKNTRDKAVALLNHAQVANYGGTAGQGVITFGLNALVDNPKTVMIVEGALTGLEVLGSLGFHLFGMPKASATLSGAAGVSLGSILGKVGRKKNFEAVQKDPKRLASYNERVAQGRGKMAEVGENPEEGFSGALPNAGNYDPEGRVTGSFQNRQDRREDRRERLTGEQKARREAFARRVYWAARQRMHHPLAMQFSRRFSPPAIRGLEEIEANGIPLTGEEADLAGPAADLLASLLLRAFPKTLAPQPNAATTVTPQKPLAGELTEADLQIAELAGLGAFVETETGKTFVPILGDDGAELTAGDVANLLQHLYTLHTSGDDAQVKGWWSDWVAKRKQISAIKRAGKARKKQAKLKRDLAEARRSAEAEYRPAEEEEMSAENKEADASNVFDETDQQYQNE